MSCAPPQPAPLHPAAQGCEMRRGCSSERAGLCAPARTRGAMLRPPPRPAGPWKARGVARIICAASSGAGERCAQRRQGN